MRNKITTIILLMIAGLLACTSNKPTTISGKLSDTTITELFVYKISNHHYNRKQIIDTIAVQEGGFSYSADSLLPQMLFIGTSKYVGGKVLWDAQALELEGELIAEKEIKWQDVNKLSLHSKYREYKEDLYIKSKQATIDSFNLAFRAARKENNREEMARIKEASMPYHNKMQKIKRELINQTIAKNAKNKLGLHLFYAHRFENQTFNTTEEISGMRDTIASFGISSQQSAYIPKMEDQLQKFEKCAVGQIAPEIAGNDRDGKRIKLSDLRGQYVLVDFWNSYCGWCRKESPSLIKAYEAFKDKGFTILGASSDSKKELWIKAINEDNTGGWNHLMFEEEEGQKIRKNYCIKGIPHIILISPEGKIIAKNLRGDDIYNIIKENI